MAKNVIFDTVFAIFVFSCVMCLSNDMQEQVSAQSDKPVAADQAIPYSPQLCALHGIGCVKILTDRPEKQGTVEQHRVFPANPHGIHTDFHDGSRTAQHSKALLELEIARIKSEILVLQEMVAKERTMTRQAYLTWCALLRRIHKVPLRRITFAIQIIIVFTAFFIFRELGQLFRRLFSPASFPVESLFNAPPDEGAEAIIHDAYKRYIILLSTCDTLFRFSHILPVCVYLRANFLVFHLLSSHLTTFSALSMTVSALTGLQISSMFLSAQFCMLYAQRWCLSEFFLWTPIDKLSYSSFQKRVFESFRYNQRSIRQLEMTARKGLAGNGKFQKCIEV